MNLDFAPLEGITGAAFRRLHHKYFSGVDRYYTPFLSPTKEHLLTPREQRELLPEYNTGITVVPQILTKVPADFLWAAELLHGMGYTRGSCVWQLIGNFWTRCMRQPPVPFPLRPGWGWRIRRNSAPFWKSTTNILFWN